MSDNADQEEFWSGQAGAKWIAGEAEQDYLLSAVAAAVMTKAGPKRGERVLDIGCGTGAVTLLAASAVGAEGHVLATDIAAPFIARVEARAADLPQVATMRGDAQSAVWPEPAFDVAVSRFGVMFFSDPAAAFANIARALRPGGRMVFAAWGRTEDNPYWQIPRDLVDRLIAPQPRPEPHAPGPMGLADTDWTMERLRLGGLTDIGVETRNIPLVHEGGAEGAANLALRIGPAARALADANMAPEAEAQFRSAMADAFSPFDEGGPVRIPASIHLYTARRP